MIAQVAANEGSTIKTTFHLELVGCIFSGGLPYK